MKLGHHFLKNSTFLEIASLWWFYLDVLEKRNHFKRAFVR